MTSSAFNPIIALLSLAIALLALRVFVWVFQYGVGVVLAGTAFAAAFIIDKVYMVLEKVKESNEYEEEKSQINVFEPKFRKGRYIKVKTLQEELYYVLIPFVKDIMFIEKEHYRYQEMKEDMEIQFAHFKRRFEWVMRKEGCFRSRVYMDDLHIKIYIDMDRYDMFNLADMLRKQGFFCRENLSVSILMNGNLSGMRVNGDPGEYWGHI